MHQSEACAGPVHLTGQAQPLNLPPRLQQPNVDLVSPTCACVLPAETMMRFLRAGGQIEWLSIMTVMHGLRAARQSMLSARARLPRLILGAAAPAPASRLMVMRRQPSSLHAGPSYPRIHRSHRITAAVATHCTV